MENGPREGDLLRRGRRAGGRGTARADGFEAHVERERLAGEDDDEDHPWAVLSDAPAFMLEVLVDTHDGWLDEDDGSGSAAWEQPAPSTPLHLPTAPSASSAPT